MWRTTLQRRYVSKSRLQTSRMVGRRGKDTYSSTSRSTYQTRAHYGYTPYVTTMTTPQQYTSGRRRPQSQYATTTTRQAHHAWMKTTVTHYPAAHATRLTSTTI